MTASQPLKLAKDALDIGLFTEQSDEVIKFWVDKAGVEEDHVLPISKTVKQHRFAFGDGVLKINQSKEPLRDSPKSNFGRVLIASDSRDQVGSHLDPDGTELCIAPPSEIGCSHWALEVKIPSRDAFLGFYNRAVGLPIADNVELAVKCGESLIIGRVEADVASPQTTDVLQGVGLRYFTIQVFDVDSVYEQVISAGGLSGMSPVTMGKTARIAFVRDPGGNWIELSQRASLTGPLDDKE